MGRVEAISIDGLVLWFNSSDHLPPHFHVKKVGHWEIRVHLLECTQGKLVFTTKWPKSEPRISRADRRTLLDATLAHRETLLAEWEAKVVVSEEDS